MRKYILRFTWYIAWRALAVVFIFAAMFAAFFIAMDSANVYVVVTDGLAERADAILYSDDSIDLTPYFDPAYLQQDNLLNGQTYLRYSVSDYVYHLKVESLWCQPWAGVARVTVEESIPTIDAVLKEQSEDAQARAAQETAPAWVRGRYVLTCRNIDDRWLITDMELTAVLEPEPTPSPDPALATPSPAPAEE